MPGTLVQELFNGGLVTIREPSLLREGELQECSETVYRKFDPAIQGAWNRTEYDSTPTVVAPVKGLAHLTFDGARSDRLLAYISTNIYHGAFTAVTGTLDTKLTSSGVVTPCTIASTTIVTTTGDQFASMIPGARAIHPNIPVGAVVQTVDNSNQVTLSLASTNGSGLSITFLAGIPIVLSDVGTETLEAVQFGNAYFLLTGNGLVHRATYETMGNGLPEAFVGRQVGMLPVRVFGDGGAGSTSGPAIVAGSWSAVLGTGYYWFLVTEAINATRASSEVESAYLANDGRAQVVQVTDVTTQAVRITFPTVTNTTANGVNQATHWCIYMSEKQADSLNMPSLATFKLVAVERISATTSLLSDTNPIQSKAVWTTSAAVAGFNQWSTPSGSSTQSDGSSMVSKSGGSSYSANTLGRNTFGGWGFDGAGVYAGLTVRGIKISVIPSNVGVVGSGGHFYLYATTSGGKRSIQQFGSTKITDFLFIFGGPTDTLGVSWVPADFADGTFFVDVGKTDTVNSPEVCFIDGFGIVIYYSGTSVNLNGRSFPVVTYRSQVGTTVSDPSNLPPPKASTGDVFNGHMVLNDVEDDNVIAPSLPGKGEYFPKPYRMKLNSRKKDKVTFIRTLQQILIVGLTSSIKRVNYIPTETDPSFQLGLAHEDFATDHGIVGPMAGTLVDMPGVGVVLIYVSYKGVHVTDGVTTRFINHDLDWANTVDLTNLHKCVLRSYPAENIIKLFYAPFGGAGTNSKSLIFSYSPDKIKEGGLLPAAGPNSVSGRSACEATLAGVSKLLTGHETNGKVYVEDNGTSIPSGYTAGGAAVKNVPVVRTRLIYPAGIQNDVREERIYILCSANGTTYSKTSVTTVDSLALTSAAQFDSNIRVGMLVVGDNIQPGTVVTVKTDTSNLTLSLPAIASGSGTLVFSDGVLAVQVRGRNIKEAVTNLGDIVYDSTHVGGLLEYQPDNLRHSFELRISRTTLPDGTTVDLSVPTRLHYFSYLVFDGGTLMKRT